MAKTSTITKETTTSATASTSVGRSGGTQGATGAPSPVSRRGAVRTGPSHFCTPRSGASRGTESSGVEYVTNMLGFPSYNTTTRGGYLAARRALAREICDFARRQGRGKEQRNRTRLNSIESGEELAGTFGGRRAQLRAARKWLDDWASRSAADCAARPPPLSPEDVPLPRGWEGGRRRRMADATTLPPRTCRPSLWAPTLEAASRLPLVTSNCSTSEDVLVHARPFPP